MEEGPKIILRLSKDLGMDDFKGWPFIHLNKEGEECGIMMTGGEDGKRYWGCYKCGYEASEREKMFMKMWMFNK